jgi:hypothetical protein
MVQRREKGFVLGEAANAPRPPSCAGFPRPSPVDRGLGEEGSGGSGGSGSGSVLFLLETLSHVSADDVVSLECFEVAEGTYSWKATLLWV